MYMAVAPVRRDSRIGNPSCGAGIETVSYTHLLRGQHIGEALVRHCMEKAKELGFRVLQFNAVVRTNEAALRLYARLGFVQLGVIPGGFLKKDGTYEDIIPHYHLL